MRSLLVLTLALSSAIASHGGTFKDIDKAAKKKANKPATGKAPSQFEAQATRCYLMSCTITPCPNQGAPRPTSVA